MTREELITIKNERGYSIAQISEYSGVPFGTVQKIFSGETTKPRPATLKAIERVMDGPESVFLGKKFEYSANSSVNCVEEGIAKYSVTPKEKKTVIQGIGYTVEDYFNLPDDQRKELIDGVFYDMATPVIVHQDLVGHMYFEILNYIRTNKGKCKVMLSPSSVQLDCDDRTMVEPDVYIVCDKDKIKQFGIFGAPDFVLEVISPSTRNKDYRIKVYKYINAGVREIWYLDPYKKILVTYYEGNDYMPEIHALQGNAEMAIYGGKLKINLNEIKKIIEEAEGK